MKRSILFAAVLAVTLTPTTALGDPNLPDVPPHRHNVLTPTGDLVEVGPRVCDDPSLQDAFNQFHNNVHQSFGVPAGDVRGPSAGAPGLHNGNGAEIRASRC